MQQECRKFSLSPWHDLEMVGWQRAHGWLQLPSNDGFKICQLMDLKKEFKTDFSSFTPLHAYIELETEAIVKRSFVQRALIPQSEQRCQEPNPLN